MREKQPDKMRKQPAAMRDKSETEFSMEFADEPTRHVLDTINEMHSQAGVPEEK
jgi:hypothetical protein